MSRVVWPALLAGLFVGIAIGLLATAAIQHDAFYSAQAAASGVIACAWALLALRDR